ncbi:hypothetical protein PYW08_015778 [Mythimna loreyi]|uniref:Uncharacterized protein n=1 Tax=Mythimna loreyi TaxID=667449 RepID=A0ACC2QTL4_9NEOP|nr:hypothetical protein PYW08_015778 [Mythimna loreyi]
MARDKMNKDGIKSRSHDSDIRVVQFDLQQQMYLPTLTHTQMYYSRQLACVNMGIHLEDEGKGIMFLWNETVGQRGSNEIASCLYKFFTDSEIGHTTSKQKLILWSDNCGGQNKNQAVLVMFLVLIAKGFFTKVTHKFPVKGHTFLACDRDFAIIEKSKRRAKPQIPKDLIELVANAAKKNPFLVVDTKTFFNWMNLARTMINTKNLQISSATMIRVTSDNFGVIYIKKSYGEYAPWCATSVLKPGITKASFEGLEIEMKETPVPLSAEKKKDISAMLPYLAGENKLFYENLIK